jgi:hypothetical protein
VCMYVCVCMLCVCCVYVVCVWRGTHRQEHVRRCRRTCHSLNGDEQNKHQQQHVCVRQCVRYKASDVVKVNDMGTVALRVGAAGWSNPRPVARTHKRTAQRTTHTRAHSTQHTAPRTRAHHCCPCIKRGGGLKRVLDVTYRWCTLARTRSSSGGMEVGVCDHVHTGQHAGQHAVSTRVDQRMGAVCGCCTGGACVPVHGVAECTRPAHGQHVGVVRWAKQRMGEWLTEQSQPNGMYFQWPVCGNCCVLLGLCGPHRQTNHNR